MTEQERIQKQKLFEYYQRVIRQLNETTELTIELETGKIV